MAAGKVSKFKFGTKLSAGAKEKEAGVVSYAGEKPPPGTYRLKLKRLFMDENRAGPTMRYLAEVDEKRPALKKFNGYPIWGGQNINDQSIGFLNQMLIAFANGSDKIRNAFHDSEGEIVVKADEKDVQHITKIGGEKINVDSIVFFGVCTDNSYKSKTGSTVTNLQVQSYVPKDEVQISDEEDDEPEVTSDEVDEDEVDEDGDLFYDEDE